MSTTIDTLATAIQEAARAKVAAYEACQKAGGDGTYWAPAAERAALDAADLKLTAAAAPDGFKPPPDLHQAPKVRAAPVVKVCPVSVEQRARWAARAAERGMSLSAWLAEAADAVLDR